MLNRCWLLAIFFAITSGCVSQGPGLAKINFRGQTAARVVAAVNQRDIKIVPIDTGGVAICFDGLLTSYLREYVHDWQVRYAPRVMPFMAVDHLRFISECFWSSRENEKIVVFGFSNNNSVCGMGGRNGFLKQLEKQRVQVDLLVLFDDTWGGRIPSNVVGVINVYTGDWFSGRPVTLERLGNPQTWYININLPELSHACLPLFTGGAKSDYEEFTRRLYTALVLEALRDSSVPTERKEVADACPIPTTRPDNHDRR